MPDEGGARVGPVLIALFAVALFLFFIGTIAEIVLLVFVAAVLGTYFGAFTDLLVRATHLARAICLLAAFLLTAVGLIALAAVIMPPVMQQTTELLSSLPEIGQQLENTLVRMSEQYPVFQFEPRQPGEGTAVERIFGDFSGFVGESLVPYLTAGGKVLVELFSVLAMAIYFARNPNGYREGFISLFPPKVRHVVRRTVTDLGATLRAWIGGQFLAMVFLAAVSAIGFWILQVPFALAFGVFTGAVAVVPFFGTIVSTILPAMVVLASGGWGHAFAVLVFGIVVHIVEANVVYPMIFQVRIRLPPVLTILSVLVAASLLGVLGLIAAVPLLATLIVVVRHVLIGEIYGEQPAGGRISAVLVPTQEFRKVAPAGG